MVLPHDLGAIARRAEAQCSIGFQPVSIHTIERFLSSRPQYSTVVTTGDLTPLQGDTFSLDVPGVETTLNPHPPNSAIRDPQSAFDLFLIRFRK